MLKPNLWGASDVSTWRTTCHLLETDTRCARVGAVDASRLRSPAQCGATHCGKRPQRAGAFFECYWGTRPARRLADGRRLSQGPAGFEAAPPQQPPWRHARHQLAQALGFVLPVVPARPG